ncbi:MAG: twin-arginine translocase subunit TatC [Armatimonadetes bacterium]|nr:twin-arginine translocase subunit TatC [Armatimonadota bacterium]
MQNRSSGVDDPDARTRSDGERARRERKGERKLMAHRRRDQKEDFKEMELWEHLAELRTRMIRTITYIGVGAAAGWFIYPWLYRFLEEPLRQVQQHHPNIKWAFRHLTEPFFLRLKVAVISGLVLAMPPVLGEIWGFVAPGLTRRERKVFYLALPLSVFFFTLGAAAGWLVLPPAMEYFVSFLTPGAGVTFELLQDPADYILFIVKMILAFGLVFELPVVLMGLGYAGLLNSRALTKHWRTAVVGLSIVAAVVTPSNDALTMSMMLVPLVILYFGSIFLVKWVEKRKHRPM